MFGVFGPLFILPKGKQHGSFSISLFTQLYGLNFGIDVQTYAERGKENDFPLLKKCPHCRAKRPLHRHGYYERNA
ncbi:hypothetical protein ETC04_18805, partial [Geobacillus sp. MR]|nr:hypothetical protein [Geobacillus sp. MR]